jgi:hypothetical protein
LESFTLSRSIELLKFQMMLVCLPSFAQGQWLWVFEYLGRAPLLEGGGAIYAVNGRQAAYNVQDDWIYIILGQPNRTPCFN